ncbi:MAG: (4Fe-4S)-binding protein [Actinobacteria bacterium]|nr:(4Fe-4S)-binding protein [Actinomycetota bacterium]MBI3686975.1 (4Fe-4S)-binding protein [Actinomycetota bacterium]
MRIVMDREYCVGSGQCVLSAPELFDQSEEDGRVLLRTARPEPAAIDRSRIAVDLCPSRALSLADD